MPEIMRNTTINFIHCDGRSQSISATREGSVMQLGVSHGIDAIVGECGGNAMCATCHVYVDPEWQSRLPAAMSDERELLSELAHHQVNSRLSCQIEFTPDLAGLRVTVAPDE